MGGPCRQALKAPGGALRFTGMNYMRTGLLLAAMTAIFMAAGFLLGGEAGMAIAFLFAAGMNLFAYWNSDKMVLRMYGAREVDSRSAPELYALVARLAVETIATWAIHIKWDRSPEDFDPVAAKEAVLEYVLRGLLSESEICKEARP